MQKQLRHLHFIWCFWTLTNWWKAMVPCIGLSRTSHTYTSIGATSFSVTENNLTVLCVHTLCTGEILTFCYDVICSVWTCPYTVSPLPWPASKNDQLTNLITPFKGKDIHAYKNISNMLMKIFLKHAIHPRYHLSCPHFCFIQTNLIHYNLWK